MRHFILLALFVFGTWLTPAQSYDVIIKGGTVYDGTGRKPVRADVGIKDDKIVRIADLKRANAALVIDASGMAVAPGFINMLSWSTESLLVDPRSLGELKQG
ncbi:MAG TPA: hypothetical protein PKM58_07325, partial [Pyrinomonadaceae bacterium]|nr:hypothetical protein [Pyrinomonadaceae bacterium]